MLRRLRILAEQMKRSCRRARSTLAVDDIVPGDRGTTVIWQFRMTRPELEWASLALVERTFKVCQQALDAAGVGPAELDRVILVGGATRMPMVARKVEQFFRPRRRSCASTPTRWWRSAPPSRRRCSTRTQEERRGRWRTRASHEESVVSAVAGRRGISARATGWPSARRRRGRDPPPPAPASRASPAPGARPARKRGARDAAATACLPGRRGRTPLVSTSRSQARPPFRTELAAAVRRPRTRPGVATSRCRPPLHCRGARPPSRRQQPAPRLRPRPRLRRRGRRRCSST